MNIVGRYLALGEVDHLAELLLVPIDRKDVEARLTCEERQAGAVRHVQL